MNDEWQEAVVADMVPVPGAGRRVRAPQRPAAAPKEDELPAHSPECERGVLGCILLAPAECLDDCAEMKVEEEWFYELRHQLIYHGMRRLHAAGQPVDTVTLVHWLRDAGHLEGVGGLAYISELPDASPSAENLLYYLDHVREKFYARAATVAFLSGLKDLQANTNAPAIVLAQMQKKLEDLSELATTPGECQVKSVLGNVLLRMEENYHRGSAQMTGLSTGLEYLDKILCGIGGDNGNMIVISARPGVGKTSIALQVILHAAMDHRHYTPVLGADGLQLMDGDKKQWTEHRGVPAFVFSLEMSDEALVKRLLFQRAKADMQRFRTGFALEKDFAMLSKASSELSKAPIYIDATGRCTIDELKAKARRAHRQLGIKLFVIDYIQLLRVSRRDRRQERREELEEISGEIFKLGKELNVPFIVLAQMNRDFEKEPNRMPRLSDLKDCGAIEQDADVIMFLSPTKKRKDDEGELEEQLMQVYGKDWLLPMEVDLLVAKNRHGMSDATCKLLFQKSSTLFLDLQRWKKDHGFAAAAKGEKKVKLDTEDYD